MTTTFTKKLTLTFALILSLANTSAFARHPNWEFPFLRGLTVASQSLVTNTQDNVIDVDFWEHHVALRYNMATAMASQIDAQLPTIRDQNISRQLQSISRELRTRPRDIDPSAYVGTTMLFGNVDDWVYVANLQQAVYENVNQHIHAMLDQVPASADYIEYPFLLGLSIAAESLVQTSRFNFGTADLWSHHFDLRMNAAYSFEHKLREAVNDLPPEHDEFRNAMLEVADEIAQFPNYTRAGDADYWTQEIQIQQELFVRVRDRVNELLNMSKQLACEQDLMP